MGIKALLGRNKKVVLFKIYFFFSINIDMVDFRVLFYLYRNRNISGIIENKKYFYMTVLVEGYNIGIKRVSLCFIVDYYMRPS